MGTETQGDNLMKCFTCGNTMRNVNDYSNEGWGWITIYKCPKCGSYGQERVNTDNFVKEIMWKADYEWDKEK